MRVHVVSDVHGRTDALARAGAGADVLICLGDLVLYVDYHDHSAGIMADLFGAEAVTRLIELRTARRFDEARTWSLGLWAHFDADPRVVLEDAIRRQYAEMFAVLPTPTFIHYLRQRRRAGAMAGVRPPGRACARRRGGRDRRPAGGLCWWRTAQPDADAVRAPRGRLRRQSGRGRRG